MGTKNSKPLFTLSVTAEIIGVHPRTLMIYENEKLVLPHRTKTNRRRYSQENVKTIQFIRFLTTKRGVNLSGVRCVLDMIEKFEKENENIRQASFPDFIESSVFE